MAKKMTTAVLKKFIVSRIAASAVFKNELLDHEIDNVHPSRWSRNRKAKIKEGDLSRFAFMYEDGIAADLRDDGMANHPKLALHELVGCVERGFLHKDADCFVGIVTDPTDSHVVAWYAQVD